MKAFAPSVVLAALLCPLAAIAGGPRYVAGTAYFDPAATGQPIVWANGQVSYYTDQGDLSPEVNQSQANAMVAAAAAVWNAVPTAAVNITRGGSLAEDVNGTNVTFANGALTIPTDIQSGDTAQPVAIVYDEDGSVTNTFFGAGASSPSMCQQDGVFTFVDNLTPAGNIAHALVLVNGLCATNTAQIAILQYQLIRAFGRVLGLDWSQANEEMFANNTITSEGLAGWPVMHPIERLCHASGQSCMPNDTTLRPDDIAALNRLYPLTTANLSSFPNKELTAANTISVTGTIRFRDGQGMQGVNVVLRPMLSGTDLPDVRYTVTAVSGARFHGNAGNPVTGFTDAAGNPLVEFGSGNPSLEGYFDLNGVPVPPGEANGRWQLSFEPINPLDTGTESVGPYTTGQVSPSGTLPTINIPVLAAGSSVIEDVTVGNSAGEELSGNDGTVAAPVTVPPAGEWTARLTGYGHSSWFQFWAKANREFTVETQALNENGNPTLNKAEPVIGVWSGSNSADSAPLAATPQPFNGSEPGLTTLPVITMADGLVRIGVSDLRGDGRPDYLYRGRVLYADTVTPTVLPATGGPIVITGMGFRPDSEVMVNGITAQVTSVSPTQITAVAPASTATGNIIVEVTDPQTMGVALIADGLSYGAANADTIKLISAPSGSIPSGEPLGFTVAVGNGNAADPAPSAGATVTWTVTQGAATLACGADSCSAVTTANGIASLAVAAESTSPTVVTATLTNGASVSASFTASASAAMAISALTPNLYLAAGATAEWTPEGLVLNHGAPAANAAVTWTPMASGVSAPTSASLSATNGIVTEQLAAGPLDAGVTVPVNACLASEICTQFNVISVSPAVARLVPIAEVAQEIPATENFEPVLLEVTDAAGDPLAGATVTIYETLDAWTPACASGTVCAPAPLLAQQTEQLTSGANGLVTFTPISSAGTAWQAVRMHITAVTASTAALSFTLDRYPQ